MVAAMDKPKNHPERCWSSRLTRGALYCIPRNDMVIDQRRNNWWVDKSEFVVMVVLSSVCLQSLIANDDGPCACHFPLRGGSATSIIDWLWIDGDYELRNTLGHWTTLDSQSSANEQRQTTAGIRASQKKKGYILWSGLSYYLWSGFLFVGTPPTEETFAFYDNPWILALFLRKGFVTWA